MSARRALVFFGLLGLAGLDATAAPRPGYEAGEARRARHQALTEKAVRPVRSNPHLRVAKDEPSMVAQGRLERFEDGVIWISVPVGPEQAAALMQTGMTMAVRREDARPGTIFEGRAWTTYSAGPSAEACPACDPGVLGPDPTLLEHRVGQDVLLTLTRDAAGRLRVVGVGAPR